MAQREFTLQLAVKGNIKHRIIAVGEKNIIIISSYYFQREAPLVLSPLIR